jgi:hypothetical protein
MNPEITQENIRCYESWDDLPFKSDHIWTTVSIIFPVVQTLRFCVRCKVPYSMYQQEVHHSFISKVKSYEQTTPSA